MSACKRRTKTKTTKRKSKISLGVGRPSRAGVVAPYIFQDPSYSEPIAIPSLGFPTFLVCFILVVQSCNLVYPSSLHCSQYDGGRELDGGPLSATNFICCFLYIRLAIT